MNLAEWSSAADAATRALGQPAYGVRQHLIERMRDREISLSDLNQLRPWVETRPEVSEATGSGISDLSKSAAAVRTPKHSCSEGSC